MPLIVLLSLAIHSCYIGSKMVVSLLALELGASQAVIGVVAALYAVVPMLTGIYAGRLADRIGMRVPLLIGAGCTALAMLCGYVWQNMPALFVTALLMVLPFLKTQYLLMAVSFVIGIGSGVGQPLSMTLSYNRSPAGRAGEVTGLRLTFNNISRIVIPLVSGSLGAAFGAGPVFCMNAGNLVAISWLARR